MKDYIDYIEAYNSWEDLYQAYFGENADVYWEIYQKHECKERISYDKLSMIYCYSATKLRNIVYQVKEFLDDPQGKMMKTDYPCSVLYDKQIRMPTLFIGHYSLPLMENKLFHEAICLYQNLFPLWIPRSHILEYGKQYVNANRREKVYQNLRDLKIYTTKGTIQIFERIDADKTGMSLAFTDQALEYIDPVRYIMTCAAEDSCEVI